MTLKKNPSELSENDCSTL